jgi:L-amino acid N-acyltransferase YncA
MKNIKPDIVTRPATPNDTSELRRLLNEIIDIGGTTAIETQLTDDAFGDYFLHGESHLCCHVAVDGSGNLAGFQTLARHVKLSDDWADIATFARVKPKSVGVGTALFAKTKFYAKQKGIIAINATIRADNEGGLIYYDKMGFETYSLSKDVPLNDGTRVDRISKRFLLDDWFPPDSGS